MEIKLSKKHQKIIADYMENGEFSDARGVIEEALEIMLETEEGREKAWEKFKDKVREGEEAIVRGEHEEFTSMEELLNN